jgi:hypothetical protein
VSGDRIQIKPNSVVGKSKKKKKKKKTQMKLWEGKGGRAWEVQNYMCVYVCVCVRLCVYMHAPPLQR